MNGWGFEGNAPPNIFEQMQAMETQSQQQRLLEINALEAQRITGMQGGEAELAEAEPVSTDSPIPTPESYQGLSPFTPTIESNRSPSSYESSQIEGITHLEDMARASKFP